MGRGNHVFCLGERWDTNAIKKENKDWALTSNKHYTEITFIDHTETANSSLEISDPVCLKEHVLSGCQWHIGRAKRPI